MIQKSSWIAGSHITVHSFSAELQPTLESPTLVITANYMVMNVPDWCYSKIMENINSILHHGTLVLYPSLNPDGLRNETLPEGKADLNRRFPGKNKVTPQNNTCIIFGMILYKENQLL